MNIIQIKTNKKNSTDELYSVHFTYLSLHHANFVQFKAKQVLWTILKNFICRKCILSMWTTKTLRPNRMDLRQYTIQIYMHSTIIFSELYSLLGQKAELNLWLSIPGQILKNCSQASEGLSYLAYKIQKATYVLFT